MTLDLTAWDNEPFRLTLDVSAFSGAYDLATASWRLQARSVASSPSVVLSIPDVIGTAAYAAGAVVFAAPIAAVAGLKGSYKWDFGFVPVGGEFIRAAGGALTIHRGVTR